jgi:hypothetical protein
LNKISPNASRYSGATFSGLEATPQQTGEDQRHHHGF